MTTHAPVLRLSGLKTSQLPSPSASPDELRPFVTALLEEAVPFIDSAAPRAAGPDGPAAAAASKGWKTKGTKRFPESEAKVELSERVVPLGPGREGTSSGGGEETWACRRSVHADAARKGAASWAEFAACIRDDHAATEDAFTPTVLGRHEAAAWVGAAGLGTVEAGGGRWGGFAVGLVEMKHKVPPPLRPRVFPVLQVVCSSEVEGGEEARDEFLVVSVTVEDLAAGGMGQGARLCGEKGVVVGAYASVERVRRLPAQEGEAGQIEWVMATASDARGILPMWVQTKAVPGQIAKDVSMFLGWLDSERKKNKGGDGEAKEAKEAKKAKKGEETVTSGAQQSGNGPVAAAS